MSFHFLEHNARRCAEAHKTEDLKPAAQQVAQALCNAAMQYNAREDTPMTPNEDLPELTDWTAHSRSNWRHMVELGFALLFEYNYRKSRSIETVKQVLAWARSMTPYNMPERGLQRLPYYGDTEYSEYASDTVNIWRIAYTDAPAQAEDWGDRDMPDWFIQSKTELISGRKSKLQKAKK